MVRTMKGLIIVVIFTFICCALYGETQRSSANMAVRRNTASGSTVKQYWPKASTGQRPVGSERVGTSAISGTIQPAGALKAVSAIHQKTLRDYKAKDVDQDFGYYLITGLPEGRYDLLIRTKDAIYEGLLLDDVLAYYPEVSEKVVDELRPKLKNLEEFYPQKHIIRCIGDEKELIMLVELTRDGATAYYNDGSRAIGRIFRAVRSFHYLKMSSGVWMMKPWTNREHFREDAAMNEAREAKFYFSEKLGGIEVTSGKVSENNNFSLQELVKEKIGEADYGKVTRNTEGKGN